MSGKMGQNGFSAVGSLFSDRLLDPDNPSVTLLTLERAARALGKNIRIEIAA